MALTLDYFQPETFRLIEAFPIDEEKRLIVSDIHDSSLIAGYGAIKKFIIYKFFRILTRRRFPSIQWRSTFVYCRFGQGAPLRCTKIAGWFLKIAEALRRIPASYRVGIDEASNEVRRRNVSKKLLNRQAIRLQNIFL